MRDPFKIVCNNCKSELAILDDGFKEIEGNFQISFNVDLEHDITFECSCGNLIKF